MAAREKAGWRLEFGSTEMQLSGRSSEFLGHFPVIRDTQPEVHKKDSSLGCIDDLLYIL